MLIQKILVSFEPILNGAFKRILVVSVCASLFVAGAVFAVSSVENHVDGFELLTNVEALARGEVTCFVTSGSGIQSCEESSGNCVLNVIDENGEILSQTMCPGKKS